MCVWWNMLSHSAQQFRCAILALIQVSFIFNLNRSAPLWQLPHPSLRFHFLFNFLLLVTFHKEFHSGLENACKGKAEIWARWKEVKCGGGYGIKNLLYKRADTSTSIWTSFASEYIFSLMAATANSSTEVVPLSGKLEWIFDLIFLRTVSF